VKCTAKRACGWPDRGFDRRTPAEDQAIRDPLFGLGEPSVPFLFRDGLRLHPEFGGEHVPGDEQSLRPAQSQSCSRLQL
jgi:hypothetical protein